jgi:Fe-S oxidoreductase
MESGKWLLLITRHSPLVTFVWWFPMKLENVAATLESCRFCLMCRHVDPVSHVAFNEALTPHGIALTATSQKRGLVEWNQESVKVIYSDVDGGNARAHCVTNKPFSEAVAAVKAEIVAKGFAPQSVYDVHEKLLKYHSAYGQERLEPNRQKSDTALFVGDEAHYLWPNAIDAGIKLLKALGYKLALVGRGQSNGFLASSLGFPELAETQAKGILEDIQNSSAKQVITLSVGDTFVLTQLYPERLGVSLPKNVQVTDVLSLLATALEKKKLSFKQSKDKSSYAYIDPTHAVRVPNRFDAPRVLLKAVLLGEAKELFWRRERAHPVGSTAVQFTNPELAEKLTRARLEDALNTGAKQLYCEDPATLHHLNKYAKDYGLEVKGLYELLATQLAKE